MGLPHILCLPSSCSVRRIPWKCLSVAAAPRPPNSSLSPPASRASHGLWYLRLTAPPPGNRSESPNCPSPATPRDFLPAQTSRRSFCPLPEPRVRPQRAAVRLLSSLLGWTGIAQVAALRDPRAFPVLSLFHRLMACVTDPSLPKTLPPVGFMAATFLVSPAPP